MNFGALFISSSPRSDSYFWRLKVNVVRFMILAHQLTEPLYSLKRSYAYASAPSSSPLPAHQLWLTFLKLFLELQRREYYVFCWLVIHLLMCQLTSTAFCSSQSWCANSYWQLSISMVSIYHSQRGELRQPRNLCCYNHFGTHLRPARISPLSPLQLWAVVSDLHLLSLGYFNRARGVFVSPIGFNQSVVGW